MVFINLPDPVVMGFVANLGKPEGNFTGFTAYEFVTAAKWVQTSQGIGPARFSGCDDTRKLDATGGRELLPCDGRCSHIAGCGNRRNSHR